MDSTLRGNIGAETDAMLDSLGEQYTAIVVPTFPSSGRTVVGGYLLVNGALLHKTI
ncbi:MAG: four-carbon acid sugar kinase family protein [Succinivibrio dextrinosolvens]|nr:four-carbon acid sugar kinase family protein [Succinivibrio dextrinosolvens]MDY6419597.1 four-carbon acid sugar kinase family protein [Succinivibrio dextrinosolvens]